VEEMLTANFTESENWRESGLLDAAQKALRENITVEVDVEIETVSGKKVALVGSFAPIKQGEDRWLFFAFSDELEKRQKDLELQRLLQQQKSFNATLAGEVAMHQRTISKHQLLQQALEAVPSGVVITTPLGIVEWANPAAATLTASVETGTADDHSRPKNASVAAATSSAPSARRAGIGCSIANPLSPPV